MSKLKVLSGEDTIVIFKKLGFFISAQKGSHVKLCRIIDHNTKQTLTIPNHKELDRGTLKAIYRQALRYVPDEDLRKYFYG